MCKKVLFIAFLFYCLQLSSNSVAQSLTVGNESLPAFSNYGHNEVIAKLIFVGLNNGLSLGKATLNAKRSLKLEPYSDVILNWATLAEPSLSFK